MSEERNVLIDLLQKAHCGDRCEALCEKLFARYASLEGILSVSHEQLKEVGLSEAKALFLHLIPAIDRYCCVKEMEAGKVDLSNRDQVGHFFCRMMQCNRVESIYMLQADSRWRFRDLYLIATGTITGVPVLMRSITERVLQFHGSHVMIAHNHPFGEAIPSDADCIMTDEIAKNLALVNAALADHFIVSGMEHYSMLGNESALLEGATPETTTFSKASQRPHIFKE